MIKGVICCKRLKAFENEHVGEGGQGGTKITRVSGAFRCHFQHATSLNGH